MPIYKRGNTWWVQIAVNGGKPIRRSTGTKDRALAQEFEKKAQQDVWRQAKLGEERHTWEEATAKWLRDNATKSSIKRDKEAFKIVAEFLDGQDISTITKATITKLRSALELPDEDGNTRKPATVLRILAAVRAVFNACVEWGWLTVAPTFNM
jgi:hypothetical protein